MNFSEGNNNLFARYWIDERCYEKICTYIKKNNITMNDLLMAVYYKAVWKEFRYPLHSICCAVDIRRYIEDEEAIGLCNQTGYAFTTIENAENISFEKLLEEVHGQMENEKKMGFTLKQVKLLEKVFHILPHSISKQLIRVCISNPKVALTNLGKIEKDKVTFQGLETVECYISPSLKKAPNFQMAISTFEKNILLAVNMIVDSEGKEKINNYLKTYSAILEDIVSK